MFFLGIVLILMHMFYCVTPDCPVGFYTSPHAECERCLPECRSGQVIIDTCNQTNQFICECPPNKYWDGHLALCQLCTPCDFDEVVTQNCTHLQDRKCSKCPLGTFVKTPYYCEKCLHCEQGEIVVRKCSMSENTLCMKPLIKATDEPAFTHSLTEPSHHPEKAENIESDTTVVVLSILVAFFVVALILVCLCWHLTTQRKHKYPESSFTDDSEIDDFVKKRPYPPVRETGLKLRDLNPEAIETLCSLLNPEGIRNWKMLAGKLGYSQIRIQNLQLHVGETCQKLLEEWCTERNATVYVLFNHLRVMQRDDCCELLLKYLVEDLNEV